MDSSVEATRSLHDRSLATPRDVSVRLSLRAPHIIVECTESARCSCCSRRRIALGVPLGQAKSLGGTLGLPRDDRVAARAEPSVFDGRPLGDAAAVVVVIRRWYADAADAHAAWMSNLEALDGCLESE
ncbi:unnamed protein product [Cercospora beticola]|nr:unnamed protein product [Cercospora beticola]